MLVPDSLRPTGVIMAKIPVRSLVALVVFLKASCARVPRGVRGCVALRCFATVISASVLSSFFLDLFFSNPVARQYRGVGILLPV